MFRGSYQTRVDDKGRLKVPADFKRVLEQEHSGSTKFYVTSFDGSCAMVYPITEWEKQEREVMAKPKTLPQRNHFLRNTSYYGQEVEIDGQGRLLLPPLLREKAGLTGDVSVLGMAEYLEVRNREVLDKQVEEKPFTDADAQALSEFGKQ
jgi:MraZ protein